jgi:hypothetical protein
MLFLVFFVALLTAKHIVPVVFIYITAASGSQPMQQISVRFTILIYLCKSYPQAV